MKVNYTIFIISVFTLTAILSCSSSKEILNEEDLNTINTNGIYIAYNPFATIDDGSCRLPCVQSDWMYSGACGQQHLGPAPGKANSWNGWINNQWNAFGNNGCYQLGAIMNYSQQQITPTIGCPAIWEGYGGEKNNILTNLSFDFKN